MPGTETTRGGSRSPAGPPLTWTAAIYFSYAAVFAAFVGAQVAVDLRFEDALIVLRYARNLVDGHGFVFNPGERVLGVTTPLHTLLSTIYVGLAGEAPALRAPALQNLAGLVWLAAEGFLVLLLARRMGYPLLGFFAALATLGNFQRTFLYLGMEVHLFAFLVLLAFHLYLGDRETACGVVLGLAFLTRYDAALMAALVGSALLLERRRFPWRLTLGFALPVAPWLFFAELYFGTVLPTPLAAKQGFFEAPAYLHRVFFEHKAAFKRLIALYAPGELLRAGLSYLFLVPVAAGAGAAAVRDRRWAVLAAYPFLHVGVYAAIGADPGFTWHYYVASPVLYLFFTAGACEILRLVAWPLFERARRWPRWVPAVAVALVLAPLLVHSWRQMRHRYRLDPHTAQLFEIGGRLRASYPEDTSLLQPAIGVLGWVTGFRMIDHAGLVTPGLHFFHDRRATPLGEVLERFAPDLVLLAAASPGDPAPFGYRRVEVFEGPRTFVLWERRR